MSINARGLKLAKEIASRLSCSSFVVPPFSGQKSALIVLPNEGRIIGFTVNPIVGMTVSCANAGEATPGYENGRVADKCHVHYFKYRSTNHTLKEIARWMAGEIKGELRVMRMTPEAEFTYHRIFGHPEANHN